MPDPTKPRVSRNGWRSVPIRILDAPRKLGISALGFGRRPGICAFRRGGRAWLLVGDEFGCLQLYRDILSATPRAVRAEKVGSLGDRSPLGTPFPSSPNTFVYPALHPSLEPGAFDVVAFYAGQRTICHHAALPGRPLSFTWLWPVLETPGIPAAFTPRRTGQPGLLVGGLDGVLRYHAPTHATEPGLTERHRSTGLAFDPVGRTVLAGDEPIRFDGWSHPCVADWDGAGRQDLLVGTATGSVFLFRDIGGADEVHFERGERLRGAGGFVGADSFAAPAVLAGRHGVDWLLVAGGDGAIRLFPRVSRTMRELADWERACSAQARPGRRYARGAWWLPPRVEGAPLRQVVTNCPVVDCAGAAEASLERLAENLPDDLEVKLPGAGRHEIHLLFREPDFLKQSRPRVPSGPLCGKVLVRISGESGWRILQAAEVLRPGRKELFLQAAEVKGRTLRFRCVAMPVNVAGAAWPVFLEGMRLVPCAGVAPNAATVLPPGAFSPRAIADTAMWYHRQTRLRSREDMDLLFGIHRGVGFDLLYYKLGGACWEYPSKVPGAGLCREAPPGQALPESPWGPDAMQAPGGVDRLALAVASARRAKLRLFGWIRLQNYGEHLQNGFPVSEFHRDHPELWERHRDGSPCPAKMSLAFPEVRRFVLAIVREACAYGLDGILIDFLRQLPVVLFAEPVLARFRALHGRDAREVPPGDPRLLKVQAGFTALFLREVREALAGFSPRPELHVRLASPHLGHGLDPAGIAASGDVDEILIEHRGAEALAPDLEGMLAAAAGTSCRIVPSLQRMHWGASRLPLHPEVLRANAERFHALGARALCFYESTEGVLHPGYCRGVRSLRDPAEHFPLTR